MDAGGRVTHGAVTEDTENLNFQKPFGKNAKLNLKTLCALCASAVKQID
jgi:hypothetical protein